LPQSLVLGFECGQIVELLLKGITQQEIADDFDLSKQRVQQIEFRSIEKVTAILNRKWQPEPIQKSVIASVPIDFIVAKLRTPWAVHEDQFLKQNRDKPWTWCAQKLNRTVTAVRSRVVRIGAQNKIVDVDQNRLRSLHSEGLSTTRIGIILGCSGECVRVHLNRLGLTVGNRDEDARQENLKKSLKKKWGVETITEVRPLVHRKRALSLGHGDIPIHAALVCESLKRIGHPSTLQELVEIRRSIAKEKNWHYPGGYGTVWKGAKWLVDAGQLKIQGCSAKRRVYWFVDVAAIA